MKKKKDEKKKKPTFVWPFMIRPQMLVPGAKLTKEKKNEGRSRRKRR